MSAANLPGSTGLAHHAPGGHMHNQPTAPGGLFDATPDLSVLAPLVGAWAGYRPRGGAPTDGSTTAVAVPAAPVGTDGPDPGGGDPSGPGDPPPTPVPPPAAPPTPAPAPTPPVPATPPTTEKGDPSPSGPVTDRPLDQFPVEIRDYIAGLRKEAGDNRIKAKTAEEAAEAQKQEWLTGFAKAIGLMPEVPGEKVTPEQQVAKLTEQLTGAQADHQDALRELAIWKGARSHGADPLRLADSRSFMRKVAALDPSKDDFEKKLAAAIGTAVGEDEHLRAAPPAKPAGQEPPPPPVLPPVPSGGEFAGGTGAASTEPQTVEDFRAALKESRRGR